MQAVVFSQPNCPACVEAKTILRIKGYSVDERILGENATKKDLMDIFPTARSVPQVIVDDTPIGGINELRKFFQ